MRSIELESRRLGKECGFCRAIIPYGKDDEIMLIHLSQCKKKGDDTYGFG